MYKHHNIIMVQVTTMILLVFMKSSSKDQKFNITVLCHRNSLSFVIVTVLAIVGK